MLVLNSSPSSVTVIDSVCSFKLAQMTARPRNSTKTIAADLWLSPWTVQDHLKRIFEKTDVSGRAGLAELATVTNGPPPTGAG